MQFLQSEWGGKLDRVFRLPGTTMAVEVATTNEKIGLKFVAHTSDDPEFFNDFDGRCRA